MDTTQHPSRGSAPDPHLSRQQAPPRKRGPFPSTTQPPPVGLDPLLSVEDLACYLGVPRQTIYDWRVTGRGPRAYRVGKRLRFTVADVREWMQTLADPTTAPTAGPPTPAGR